ncbi:HD family hydrolase [Labrenzia sp. PHM005]|uniref:HD domain-containing protein n=1 Tax=Stappiaceae TaxID=2821832 RepID=UPI0011400B3E|nr:HD domain-containing protein [Labrenzia sp. PHM005]QDG76682.1 HD domain-containing protein [Labrenzia sp. PHM005]
MVLDLEKQVSFLLETDKLKDVVRLNQLSDGNRRETTAEHCWHVILQTLTLAEHAEDGTDINHVIKLLAVHDLVEIDAGDHWVTDDNHADVAVKEQAAAQKIFALLPDQQSAEFRALWHEFEHNETKEARFANAMDVLHPMLLVFASQQDNPVHEPMAVGDIRKKKEDKLAPFPGLWAYAQSLLDRAVQSGHLLP